MCMIYAKDKPEIWVRYAKNLSRHTWDMFEVCLRYAWDMPEICLRYAWDMPEICLRYAWDLPEICLRYSQDMTERCTWLWLVNDLMGGWWPDWLSDEAVTRDAYASNKKLIGNFGTPFMINSRITASLELFFYSTACKSGMMYSQPHSRSNLLDYWQNVYEDLWSP